MTETLIEALTALEGALEDKFAPWIFGKYLVPPKDAPFPGKAGEIQFPNGYGASVVSHEYSYGGTEGLWELAAIEALEATNA